MALEKNVSVITISKIDKNYDNILKTLRSFCKTVSQDKYKEYILIYSGKEDISDLLADIKSIKNFRPIYSENSNWSVKRNIGLKSAVGEFVLFIDDGMEFESGWFENLIEVFEKNNDASVVCGIVLPSEPKSIWGRAQGILNHPGGGYKLVKEDLYEIEFFHTGICLARKDLMLEVMFDEKLMYGCEDMDISFRIKQKFQNAKFFLNPHAISFHHTRDNIKEIWNWMVRYGKGRTDIYYKHGLKMTEFFIHKLVLFILFLIFLTVFSPLLIPPSVLTFYIFYFVKLYKRVQKYQKVNIDLKTSLVLPLVFWIMNIAFDFGRISRIFSIRVDSFKKLFRSL